VKRKLTVGLVIAALGCSVVVWWKLHPSEEHRVTRQVERLAACVSKESAETNSIMALKMNGLTGLFVDPFSVQLVEVPFNGDYSSSVMTSHIAWARAMFDELSLTFYDITVSLTDNDTAEARFTARMVGRRKGGGELQTDTREIRCILQKIDGKWRFASFTEQAVMIP